MRDCLGAILNEKAHVPVLVLSKSKVVKGDTLVPLFASVIFLFGGRIPSFVCGEPSDPVLLPVSLVSAVGVSMAEASAVAVGAAVCSLLNLVGACGNLLAVAVLCTGKKPVPLIGCDGPPVPVASAMLRVMVRVAVDTVVVRVRGEDAFPAGAVANAS